MSTIKVDTIKDTNNVEVYTAKAWVNFNGTGTVAIRESGNVSSITDNAAGKYTVNFTNAMPDANYCMAGVVTVNANISSVNFYNTSSTSSAAEIGTVTSSSYADHQIVTVAIFR
jgi:hypothetical protein